MQLPIPDELLARPSGFAEAPAPLLAAAPSQAELFARLRLARSRRIGPVTFRRLIADHRTAIAAIEALPAIAAAAGDPGYRPAAEAAIRDEIRAARKAGARLLSLGAPGYPDRLAEIADAPPILWAQGNPDLLARPTIAVVGTRNASSLALRMARALGRDLAAAGVTIVSGLARGVDAAAHEAALEGGTVAVHAGGLDRVYPASNVALGAQIAERGCALSERAFGHSPQARDFPRRNRIVSGVAQIVVVVEAAAKSGSMITARDALDQGREVAVVPGHPFDGRAAGCLLLLRDGATLVRDASDVLDMLAALPCAMLPGLRPISGRSALQSEPTSEPDPGPDPNGLRARILSLLSPIPVPEDQLLRDLVPEGGVAARHLSAHLSEMELSGLVARRAGGALVRL